MQVRLMLCFAQSESSSLDCMSLVEPKSLLTMAADAWNLSVEHVWLGTDGKQHVEHVAKSVLPWLYKPVTKKPAKETLNHSVFVCQGLGTSSRLPSGGVAERSSGLLAKWKTKEDLRKYNIADLLCQARTSLLPQLPKADSTENTIAIYVARRFLLAAMLRFEGFPLILYVISICRIWAQRPRTKWRKQN